MTEPVVLHTVPDGIREELADRFAVDVARTEDESKALLSDAEAAVTGRFDEAWLEQAPDLEWLQAMSAGVDYLPLDAIEAAGVALTNASGVHAEPIGEQVLAYMLTFERDLHVAARHQRRGVWERDQDPGELAGKTVGVVGLGAIGSRVAELATAFRMEVVGTKRDPSTGPEAADEIHPPEALPDLLPRLDYLVLACPLTDETEGLIGAEQLRRMDDDAVLVNIARGEVVDEDDLVRGLQNRYIRGAALDVFAEEPLPGESTLWDLSNVVLTPHMSGSTPKYAERFADIVADNREGYREGGVAALNNRVR